MQEVLARLRYERQHLAPEGMECAFLERITRVSGPSWRAVTFSALDEDTADHAIEEEVAHHSALGHDFEWKLYRSDRPADLLERLRRNGFSIGPKEAVAVYDLSRGIDGLGAGNGCAVERIDDVECLEDYRLVSESVFGKDFGPTTSELASAIRRGSREHRAYVGYVDDLPASVGRLYLSAESWFGGLFGGGTLEAFRGQGCYRAVVEARARDALELGAKYLIVDAVPASFRVLSLLGFEKIDDTWPCTWAP